LHLASSTLLVSLENYLFDQAHCPLSVFVRLECNFKAPAEMEGAFDKTGYKF